MNLPRLRRALALAANLAYLGLVLAWFVVPFFVPGPGSLLPAALGKEVGASGPLGDALTALGWLVPALALAKALTLAFEGRLPPALGRHGALSLLMGFLVSGGLVACHLIHLLTLASNSSYFASVGYLAYTAFGLSVAYNVYSLLGILRLVAGGRGQREELRAFRRDRTATSESRRYAGIRRRLLLTFMSLIVVVIVVICGLLLRDFSSTLLASVTANGESIVDRAASMVKSNPGDGKDHISREDYLRDEAAKNARAIFPFNSLSYWRYESKGDAFVALESTLASQIGKRQSVPPAEARHPLRREDAGGGKIEFRSPVLLSGKVLGFVSAEYDRDVMYEPYFRTQTKVFTVAALAIYLSAFLTWFLGSAIVLPILYLNMSVNRISRNLAGMIGGSLQIKSDLLAYEDRVATRDEIKGLSVEIGDMTSVIRGVVPYISASTLKYADRDAPTTESRDLAFLFTDIRGFTSLCEGRSPESIVKLLNHYLDLQTSLILENGGDIDKFVGDEIMATFEGADKELKACRAGLAIRKAMAKEKELAQKDNRHVVSIGIGINSGPVVFGSVGARNRMDFTSIGDTVNLAARLEGANKEYMTKSLITEAVYGKVSSEFLCREIDLMTVKGKTRPVRIYEILSERTDAKTGLDVVVKVFEAGLAAYRARNWDAAAERFGKLAKDCNDATSAVFLQRIAMFRRNPPPEDWDGVFALKVK
jgi:class 3 adenylate cyclase